MRPGDALPKLQGSGLTVCSRWPSMNRSPLSRAATSQLSPSCCPAPGPSSAAAADTYLSTPLFKQSSFCLPLRAESIEIIPRAACPYFQSAWPSTAHP